MTDRFIGQILADKYRIDALIREDGTSALYRGMHTLMDKPVGIKILSPALANDETAAKDFTREVRILSRFSHPNIPNVTDYGRDASGAVYIVTEQTGNENLKENIRREGAFTVEQANRIAQQIASALSAAHAGGVVHQNLSSENIYISKTADGSDFVKVLNFGSLAANGNANFNDASAVEYLAPEKFSDSDEIDARSDIYSLGIIVYEMLAGEVPFTGETATDVMLKHAEQPPPPLSAFRDNLPEEIDGVIQRALAKVPENRYQTAKGFADDLNRAALSENNFPINRNVAVELKKEPENNMWKTAFVVLSGIAVLGAFFIYMTQVKQTNPATTLQTDANGAPVQPLNPATGTDEQSLSNMGAFTPGVDANGNPMTQPEVLPGGDGYNPWASGVPPKGAPPSSYSVPQYVPPTGQYPQGQYYDGNINQNSPFMSSDGNTYIMVPKNSNTNVTANANTQPKGKNPSNTATNTQTAPTNTKANTKPTANPSPAANTSTTAPPTDTRPRTTPTPPAKKPAEQPKTDKPANKPPTSGKPQES